MAADATRLLPDEESQLSEGLRHHEGDEDRLGRCRRCGRSCGQRQLLEQREQLTCQVASHTYKL